MGAGEALVSSAVATSLKHKTMGSGRTKRCRASRPVGLPPSRA